MLLKEYDCKQHELSQANFFDSDDEITVERENQSLKNKMKRLEKNASIHDEELLSA